MKEHLPGYMVPAAFVTMDKFPMTTNDKVDYKQLPEPDMEEAGDGQAFVGPSNEFEEILYDLFLAGVCVSLLALTLTCHWSLVTLLVV